MVNETYLNDQKVESPVLEVDRALVAQLENMGTGSPISGFGGGLEMDGTGQLQVDSSYFDGSITGVSDPLSSNLDGAGYDITNVDRFVGNSLEAEKADTRSGYTDVTSSRSLDTIETNATGSDLDVVIIVNSNVDNNDINVFSKVNGSAVAIERFNLDSSERTTLYMTVPAGDDYSASIASGDVSLHKWLEQS